MATETKTFYPGAHDASASKFKIISGATNPVGKGSDSTTRATIELTNGANAETYIFWPFDVSAIPEDATIDSVLCSVKAGISSLTGVSAITAQLYSGGQSKGIAYSPLPISANAFSLQTGSWTRDELSNCRLRLYAKRGTSSTTIPRYIYFYGADLTVTYTYQSEKFMLKLGGAWHDVARVFKKVNGIWVEVDDLSTAVDTSKSLVNGGEITS